MKFKLLINPHKNEIVQAQVHQKSIFTVNCNNKLNTFNQAA